MRSSLISTIFVVTTKAHLQVLTRSVCDCRFSPLWFAEEIQQFSWGEVSEHSLFYIIFYFVILFILLLFDYFSFTTESKKASFAAYYADIIQVIVKL